VAALVLVCAFTVAGLGLADHAGASVRGGDAIQIEVSLDRYELRVVENGRTRLRFDISLGMPSTPTPTGGFTLREVISNPSYRPGPEALRRGARPRGASPEGPLGIAKIPFQGSFQIHAGEDPLAMGKPMTLGCVGLTDASMRVLLDWLAERGAIAEGERAAGGQVHHRFLRPAYLRIR
jgi:lipoprotein-anchoring transpeptidase ErfK/SrfK